MTDVIPKAAGLFVYCEKTKRVLAVSRRNNSTQFGCIGGKVDPGENELQAALREGKEETGVDFSTFKIENNPFVEICEGSTDYLTTTYQIIIKDEESVTNITPEKGLTVSWVDLDQTCIHGPFF